MAAITMRQGAQTLLLLLAAIGSGCVSLPPPPVLDPHSPAQVPAGFPHDAPLASTLRPGDRVSVELQTAPPRAYGALEIGADGVLHVPGLGDTDVMGLTLSQAEERLGRLARMADREARVSLLLVSTAGHRVTVLGAVPRQGSYPVVPGMRLADAVAAAGGPLGVVTRGGVASAFVADLSEATITRDGVKVPVSIREALRGAPAHNVYVHPGDHIYLPFREKGSVSVLGQVHSPALLPHREGMRLTEALALAGGVTADGDRSDIRLVRGRVDAPTAYSASLADIVAGSGRDVALAPGDVLFVTDKPLEDLREALALFAPLAGLASTALLLALVAAQ